jgi:putative translation initiation factor aIF-2 beta subunit
MSLLFDPAAKKRRRAPKSTPVEICHTTEPILEITSLEPESNSIEIYHTTDKTLEIAPVEICSNPLEICSNGLNYDYDIDPALAYRTLLSRVYSMLPRDEETPKKLKFVPPQLLREGTKKTTIANYNRICEAMMRPSEHFKQYILVELNTSGSIDGMGRLSIKGRPTQSAIEKLMKKYAKAYIRCGQCKSFDTQLTKENRLIYLKCNKCMWSNTVIAIKTGFQALIKKRKKA